MTSKMETPLASRSSPKLPIITEGRSLVSPGQSSRTKATPKDQAATWASDVRERIGKCIANQDTVDEADIYELKQELVALVITVLQKDNRQLWFLLREVLLLLEPVRCVLQGKQELEHYLERLLQHLDVHKERLFDLRIQDALDKVFPKEVADIQASKRRPRKNYCVPVPPPARTSPASLTSLRSPRQQRLTPGMQFGLPDGSTPYKLISADDSWQKPKGVTFGDIRSSLADVAWEAASREAIWSGCIGTTAVALNTDLHDEPDPCEPQVPQTPAVSEILKTLDQMSQSSEEAGPEAGEAMSGRAAVEYFSKCFHTGKIKFMYFNIAPSRYFKPYDLVAVPKNKADPEHYVFSTFGVLHIYPDAPAENMTLAEWQKQAVIFRAISHIPYFKYFLMTKIFKRWRANCHFADFARIRHNVSENLLQCVPSFGAALLQVYKLCHELLHLRLLPLDEEKCFHLHEFENGINYMNKQAEKVMERFFRYNKAVVDAIADDLYKKVRYCEEQAKQKSFFTKDSLYVQRSKREEREQNLQNAKLEMSRLGGFVKLVDQILLSHLVELSRMSITSFVTKTMKVDPQGQRDGFFQAALVFTSKDQLGLSPPKDRFLTMLNHTLSKIPVLCCRAAESLGGKTQIPEPRDEEEENPRVPAMTSCLSSRDQSSHHRDSRKISQVLDSLRDRRTRTSLTGRSTRLSTLKPLFDNNLNKTYSESSIAAMEMIGTPDLQKDLSNKMEDDLGHATPSMIAPGNNQSDLIVSGQSIMGNYKPLSSDNLEEKLKKDEACQAALVMHHHLLTEALEEIEELCTGASWLNGIHAFCKSWNEESVYQWRGAAAFTIEQKLNELRQWTEKVRNFDRTYRTENGVFYIDCSGIHDNLIPKLSQIFRELCTFVAEESVTLAKTFSEEMKKVTKELKNKDTTIGGFAVYAKNVSKCKANKTRYQQNVEYIKSLFEVIRMSFRQLTSEEERLEEGVWALWEAFLFHWQDAMEFVNIQTPLITQNLEDNYQRLEEAAHTLAKTATTGKFLDPSQHPTHTLQDLKELRDQFYDVRKQMQQASKWKEAITGEPYALEFLSKMALEMDIRQELWKYVEVSAHAIQDWKNQLFSKFNVRKALDKVTEWLAAAGQLKSHLPPQDGVLTHWYRTLQEFRQELPLLHKLSSVALKARHWKAIFTNMGEQLDPTHQFLVDELLSYNLNLHAAMITSVYQAALSEFAVEQQLVKLQHMWQEKEFKVAKHIPDSVYREDTRTRSPDKKKRPRKADKSMNAGGSVHMGEEHLYILRDVEELKYLLEDSQVALQVMLSSPYLVEHKVEAQQWAESLQEVEEVIDIWYEVQTKWLYLLKIFDDPDFFRRLEPQVNKFNMLHRKFTEFMQLVACDPKVTSIMTKARGEKGYRVLQGERLRNLLNEIIQEEEDILKHLDGMIDKARGQCTRLYFLSNTEMTHLLAISRNPRALMPFVHKCFSGIKSLTFALPYQEEALNTALDYELNAHKLEVTTLCGALGETVPLYHRLEAFSSAARWMATLESYMKTTVNTIMETCVQARLEEAWGQPHQILEELEKFDNKTPESNRDAEDLMAEIRHSFNHWLLRFPAQCVLNAEAIMWERTVFWALEKQDRDELLKIKGSLTSHLEQYVKVLQENSYNCMASEMRKRLHCLLGCLINQGLHHRDILESLLQNENLSEGAYDWMKVLKYHMEISTVLRAKSNAEIDEERHLDCSPSMGLEHAGGRPINFTSQDYLNTDRMMTMIQQGYQFGKCIVSQMGTTFAYDCEYLGPTPRLAFTPLTERAYLSLTIALNTFQCGTLSGPPGTGKSDTIKDLSMALGRHLVVVNASESLTIPTMNRFLSGAVQSGCWILFDHTDRMTQGLLSVFAQQLDYVCNALRVLGASSDNQYGIRGQPTVDKKTVRGNNGNKGRIRRNSLTTLHSLPGNDVSIGNLERQSTVPHGFNEDGLITYFEDTWVAEKERRHSVAKEISIRDSEFYKNNRPPPLFYEYVTLHHKKKTNFSDLVLNYAPYKPEFLGHVLFNGHLVKAYANYGCFLTINTANPQSWQIPDNLRLLMRPCAMVKPDVKIVIEVFLYRNGFPNYKTLTSKLDMLFGLLKAQLPLRPQYDFSLRCVLNVLKLSQLYYHDQCQLDLRRHQTTATGGDRMDEQSVVRALKVTLGAMMENPADESTMQNVLRDLFPNSASTKAEFPGVNSKLLTAVKDQLSQDRLQPNKSMVDKIIQLYMAIQSGQPIILVGPAGCGKSTCYKMLAKTLTQLHYGKAAEAREEELVPERSLTFQYSQKLKILKDSNARESAKSQPKRWQKMTKISTLLNQTMSTFKELATPEESEEKYPKIDVETLYPDAYGPNEYPLVDVKVVFPNMYPSPELFGYMEGSTWHEGLISKILHNAHVQSEAARWMIGSHEERKKAPLDLPTMIQKWIVLDGTLNPAWVDAMATVLDSNKKLAVSSGLSIDLQEATSLILETGSLANASPSAIGHCSMVCCGPEVVGWRAMFEAWGQSAKQKWVLNAAGWQVLSSLTNSVFGATLTFMERDCSPALLYNIDKGQVATNPMASGVQEVASFLRFMGALLDRYLRRDDLEKLLTADQQGGTDCSINIRAVKRGDQVTEGSQHSGRLTSMSRIEYLIPNYISVIKSIFSFSFIWGFGGGLHDSSAERFSRFARDILTKAAHPVIMPESGMVYDYCADFKTGQFIRWSDRTLERARGVLTHYTVVPQIDRYNYLVDLLLSNEQPVLLTGAPGVGKSSLVEYLVQPKHPFTRLPMSPGLSVHSVHSAIMKRVYEPKKQKLAGFPNAMSSQQPNGRHLFFLDDLNTTATDGCGAQPVAELLRQLLNQQGTYDRQRQVFISLGDIDLIAAATCPGAPGSGYGFVSHMISARLMRLFTVLTMFTPSETTIYAIHSKTIQTWLEEFPGYAMEHHFELSKALVRGLLDVYKGVRERLKPTMSHSHYVFSLHDLAHVIEGILLMSPRSRAKPKPKTKLRREKELQEKQQAKTKRKTLAGIGHLPPRPDMLQARSQSWSEGQTIPIKEMTPALASVRTVTRLWCHECTRTFADRITDDEDKQWFENLLNEVIVKRFCTGTEESRDKMATIPEDSQNPMQQTTLPMPPIPTVLSSRETTGMTLDELHDLKMDTSFPTDDQAESDTLDSGTNGRGRTTVEEAPGVTSSRLSNEKGTDTLTPVTTDMDNGATTDAERAVTTDAEDYEDDETETQTSSSSSNDSESEESSSEEEETDRETDSPATTSGPSSSSSKEKSSSKATKKTKSPTFKVESKSCSQATAANKPATTPSIRRSSSVNNNKIIKRAVTFKAGLLADREVQRYTGPLLSMDQVRDPREKLTDIIFSRYIQGAHANVYGVPAERGYAEGSQNLLSIALSTCLALYNSATNQKLNLIFFKEVIQHTTRLTRTLTTFGGHALLIAQTYCTGRSTLARLAAHITNCKLFEPEDQGDPAANQKSLHDTLKRCSRVAAVRNRPVGLLIKEDLGPHCLLDISAFIKEGQCPGLYTASEVQEIATLMTPGQVKVTRVDKVEAAFNKFLLRVRQNLHVLVCMNAYGGSKVAPLQARLSHYPILLRQCCTIDVYQPWTNEALVTVAKQWLEDDHNKTRFPVPWNEHFKAEQMGLVASAMAYIHSSSKASIENLHSHQRALLKLVSPLTFKEFVHVFKVIAAYIVKEEKSKMERYEAALAKVNEAFNSITTYRREVSNLVPKHQGALSVVREHVQFVEVQREEYISALERCKEQEEIIEGLMTPLEELRSTAHAEFDQVRPTYEAAMVALHTLDKANVDEVKSFSAPPSTVKDIMEAICLLFGMTPNWENSVLLLQRPTFFSELECFNKDSIPEGVFNQMRLFYNNPKFSVDAVNSVSKAAAGLCSWVRAVYKYAEVSRNMKPKLKQLEDAEQQLEQAQALLGTKRVQANRIKSALEHRIQAHRESVKEAKNIEKQIQTIERRISKANNLMEEMATQNALWKSQLKMCRSKIRTAPGDALLAAGCVCYHGPLDNHSRAELMQDWLSRCDVGTFDGDHPGQQVQMLSLRTHLESLLKNTMATDSVPSVQHVMVREPSEISHKGEDGSSVHDIERASSSSSLTQMSLFKHQPSIYDAGVAYKTEIRVIEDGISNRGQPPVTMEAIHPDFAPAPDASRHLLGIRENYTLPEVLSCFDEQREWTLQGYPSDIFSVHNALISRVAVNNRPHSWPLLVDPDNQAKLWVTVLQGSKRVIKEGDLVQILEQDPVLLESPVDMRLDVEDEELALSRGMTMTSEVTDMTTEASTTPTTEAVTPRSGITARRLSDLNQSANEIAIAMMAAVSASLDSFPVKFSETIDRPDNNLWIVPADDYQLDAMLVNSIVHGVTILITHLERQPLKPAFNRLLQKDYDMTDDQVTVTVGKQVLNVHPDFRLFLSTSAPLFMQGDGVYPMPLPAAAVIDLSVSQEGIIRALLQHIMAVERPEFESQRLSIERDLIHHQKDQQKEQEAILQKILNLNDALLEEQDMLEALVACQEAVVRNHMILEETNYLQGHQEEKRAVYVPVALHGAKLYEIITRMSVLNPLYHLPLFTFTSLFRDTIKTHHRGKGTQGAPKARAQELVNVTTRVVYKYASTMMFSSHSSLFALLITLERLRMADKLTNQELGLFVNGIATSLIEDNIIFNDKIEWLSNKVWLDCAALETSFEVFKGLRQSLTENSSQWQEYFKCPLDLLAPVPGAALCELTVFQKCLLWRLCFPQKMWEVSQALVLYELGGVIQGGENYNLHTVYEYTDSTTPVVFILPSDVHDGSADDSTKGFVAMYPVADLVQFSRDVGHEGKVQVVTCGVSSQMTEVKMALQEAMTTGNWLVIQNAHLAETWTKDMLQLLKTVVHSKSNKEQDANSNGASPKDSTETFSSLATRGSYDDIHGAIVDEDFRLFVTTRAEEGRLIPGCLIQYGVKVTCEQTMDFKSLALHTYTSLEKLFTRRDRNALAFRKLFSHTDPIFPLAIFHSVMLHRRLYGDSAFNSAPYWSQADLATALDQLQLLLALCQRHRGVPEMISHIYGGHCHDLQDAKVVETLANTLLLSPKQLKEMPEHPSGAAELLAAVLPSGGELMEQKLEKLFDISSEQVSLSPSADAERDHNLSKHILRDLLKVCGAPDLFRFPGELSNRKADFLLQDILRTLEDLPDLPEPRSNTYYPLEAFFQSEVNLFGQLIERVQSDVTFLLKVSCGEVSMTPESQKLLLAVSNQKLPQTWCSQSFPSSLSLGHWVGAFKYRVNELSNYLKTDKSDMVVYNLAVFNRPDRFLQSVLQTYARKEFRELHTLMLQAEVVSDAVPEVTPSSGVYVGNLLIHNASWDVTQNAVTDAPYGEATVPGMPVMWLNPTSKRAGEQGPKEVPQMFNCPVYSLGDSGSLGWSRVLTRLDLPCLVKASVLSEKRAFLSCNIPN